MVLLSYNVLLHLAKVHLIFTIFMCDVGFSSPNSDIMMRARSVWNKFQSKCCSGFDDIDDIDSTQHHSTCAAFDLQTDYSHIYGVSDRENTNNTIRILFLTSSVELFQQIDRNNVNMYAGLCQNEGVVSELWGIGLQGFNALESINENINRWFQDPNFDAIHVSHFFYRAMSSALHGSEGVNLLENPFETSSATVTSRASEFPSIITKPVIILTIHELLDAEFEELSVFRPDIVYLHYEQHLGADSGGAEGGGVFNSCGEPDQGCPLNPRLQEYLRSNSHTLLVHQPHCVSADVLQAVERGLSNSNTDFGIRNRSSLSTVEEEQDIAVDDSISSESNENVLHPYKHQALLFGTILFVYYPLRTTMEQAMQYTDVISQHHRPHPRHNTLPPSSSSFSSTNCAVHATVVQQLVTYFSTLASSRLCLVGSGSSGSNSCRHVEWTLQKYYEAAGMGCVVVGDIPSDPLSASFVPMRLAGLDAATVARRVARAVALQSQGQYDNLARAAKEYVLTQRTCKSVADQFYLPALRDYLRGGRRGGVYGDTTERRLTSNTDCSSKGEFANTKYSSDERTGGYERDQFQDEEEGIERDKEELVSLWSMEVLLAAPHHSGDLPVMTASVLAGHAHSPEQQIWNFCDLYQIIDVHCHVLLRAMQGALGRESVGFMTPGV